MFNSYGLQYTTCMLPHGHTLSIYKHLMMNCSDTDMTCCVQTRWHVQTWH